MYKTKKHGIPLSCIVSLVFPILGMVSACNTYKNCIGYELCELETAEEFKKVWENAASSSKFFSFFPISASSPLNASPSAQIPETDTKHNSSR